MTAPDTRTGPRLERETFHTSRALDYYTEKGLVTETGHQPEIWPLVVVKELIDNALDAAEEPEADYLLNIADAIEKEETP